MFSSFQYWHLQIFSLLSNMFRLFSLSYFLVGTWWFVPTEASSFCSSAVRDSYLRSMTTSFGSICMGSLLVAIVEALESMVRNEREESDGLLLCLLQCLLACLRDVIEYFNTWWESRFGTYLRRFVTYADVIVLWWYIKGHTSSLEYTDTLFSTLERTSWNFSRLVAGLLSSLTI